MFNGIPHRMAKQAPKHSLVISTSHMGKALLAKRLMEMLVYRDQLNGVVRYGHRGVGDHDHPDAQLGALAFNCAAKQLTHFGASIQTQTVFDIDRVDNPDHLPIYHIRERTVEGEFVNILVDYYADGTIASGATEHYYISLLATSE